MTKRAKKERLRSVTSRLPESYRDWLDRQAELTGVGVSRSDIIRRVVGDAMRVGVAMAASVDGAWLRRDPQGGRHG